MHIRVSTGVHDVTNEGEALRAQEGCCGEYKSDAMT